MDEAISILNDPLALSICLKKQYDSVANRNTNNPTEQTLEMPQKTNESSMGYTLEPDETQIMTSIEQP